MAKIKVALDDGHGTETPGKRTPLFNDGSFMKENEFNEAVVKITGEILKKYDIDVIYVASEKTDVSLKKRVDRANEKNADIYVSVHANAFGDSWNDANGFETYIYSFDNSNNVKLAECIHNKCIAATGLKNRGIKAMKDFYVLKYTKMPAVLLECGFMTNKKEAELLRSYEYRKKVGNAIAEGILQYFAIDKEEVLLTIDEALNIIQKKCGFDDNTMKYLQFYKFAESMIIRLAEAMI